MAVTCPKCHSKNPDSKQFCADCGTQLTSSRITHPEVTETLQTPARELTTGSIFAGRYQVIEELGHGGMGRVYKVFDTDIKEKVALKLLRPEIALDKETVERFSNELRLARKISHRNVCRMFDLGRAEVTTFITMEFVPGEDLKRLIRRVGQLPTGKAVSIAKQTCEGLIEAHRFGVIHRDLKPQNIMVDEEGNARIMDFGIARSLSGKGITAAGMMIGTPEYMSPEQAEAKEIDRRSDIYSFGVILYEMVTGRVPFEGETPLSVAMKHKGEVPKSPKTLNPQISDALNQVILKCLEKDREGRYGSAEELQGDLQKVEHGLPIAERIIPKRKTLTSKEITVTFSAKKLMIPVLAFVALIAAGIILWRIVPSERPALPPSTSSQPALAVLYFENKSGDGKLDFWRNALPELLITDLSQSKYIRVVSGDEMLTILRRLGLAEAQEYSSEDIGKIAAQTRATHVLRGSFIKAGESIIITAGLQKPGTGETAKTLRLEARGENDIIPKVDELTRLVKEGFNLTATQMASDMEKDIGKITTSSPEALKYYIEGRRLHSKIEYEQSIAYMEKAVEIDPEFAMAYRSMAAAHSNMGNKAEARKDDMKALELSSRLPENERLIIEADQLRGDENYARAIEVYEKLLKAYPGHLTGHNNIALTYASAGDYDKAIEHQEFELQNRKTVITVTNLSESYMAKGFYQKAEDICRSFLQGVEDHRYVRVHLFISYVCRRQWDLALAETEKIQFLDPSAKGPRGQVLLLRDDFGGAEKILGSNALLLSRGQFNKNVSFRLENLEKSKKDKGNATWIYWRLAGALEKAGRYEEALQALDQYLKLSVENRKTAAESGLPYLPSEQKSDLFIKGRIQAEMKSLDEAQKTAGELKSLIEKGINKKELRYYEYILGLIELGKKNSRKAAELFDKACRRLDFEGLSDEFDHAMYFDCLARALYDSGNLDKARKEYEKITLLTIGRIGHGDLYAKAYHMLGKIAEKQGDKARAVENYHKFVELWKDADPGLPEVEDARKKLASLKVN